MKRIKLLTCLAISILYLTDTIAAIQGSMGIFNEKVDSLFAEYNANLSPGVAVVVVKDEEVLLNKGYGMANLEYQIPIKPTTVFDVASVSKQFTGFAISLLIEQGKISLEDDIRKYIPELHDFGYKITINHLIHHTSGLRNWTETLALAGIYDVISFNKILTMVYNQKELNFIPGSEYYYCNTGYNVLAELVQRVTGQSFREWTSKNIFQPLGMKDTHFRDNLTEAIPDMAISYAPDQNKKFHSVPNNLTALGSSSLFTTANDMVRWIKNLDNPKVGGVSVIERMYQQGKLNNGQKIPYAFGLIIDDYRGTRRISHSGSWAAYRLNLAYFPEHHFSVMVLGNTPINSEEFTQKIAGIYLADKLKPLKNKPIQNTRTTKIYDIPVTVLEELIGTYKLEPGRYLTIFRDNNKSKYQITGENTNPLNPISDTAFWLEAQKTSIMFNRNDAGHITEIRYREKKCMKMKENSKSKERPIDQYTGDYVSREIKTLYSISVKGDQLIMSNLLQGPFSLIRAWEDDFRGSRENMTSVEFYRDKKGEIKGFMVSSATNRNQRFEKIPSSRVSKNQ